MKYHLTTENEQAGGKTLPSLVIIPLRNENRLKSNLHQKDYLAEKD